MHNFTADQVKSSVPFKTISINRKYLPTVRRGERSVPLGQRGPEVRVQADKALKSIIVQMDGRKASQLKMPEE